MAARTPEFPPSVSALLKYVPPRLDQGSIGSCVGHAITHALRWHVRRAQGVDHPLSRLQAYYFARLLENSVKSDAGCEIRNAVKAVKKYGVAHEDDWPYVESKFDDAPPPDVVKKGQLWSALTYERVPVSVVGLKTALVSGFPVAIGVTLFDSFERPDVEKTGVVPVPDVDKEQMVGGHAMLCVGYGQKPGTFTVCNSWGMGWGDRGYCYVPEKYLGSTEFGGDYWVVKNIGGT